MTPHPPRPSTPRRRLAALAAAAAVLSLLSACVVIDSTRDGSAPPNSTAAATNRETAEQNSARLASALRSYAVVDDTSSPRLDVHLFGLPGATSLAAATEKSVLERFRSAGAFAGRQAFSPVLTAPDQRWDAERFLSPNLPTPPTGSAAAQAPGSAAASASAAVDLSNRIVAAGGRYLISTLSAADGAAQAAGPETAGTRAFVTDLETDSTVDAADLFTVAVDPAELSADETGTLRLRGRTVAKADLTDLGRDVSATLHTPLSLPADADTRDPDFSCALLPCVALTYDDGPGEPEIEEALLAAATTANVRLTYFLLGRNVKNSPEVVARMAEAGHELGNHTFSHPQLSTTSVADERSEVAATDDAIEAASGIRPGLVRPPYGALTKTAAAALAHPAIMWDVDTEDWRHRDRAKTVEAVRTGARPGSIVLMHSIHPTTVAAAAEVFAAVADKGLYAVTVSELFSDQRLESGAEFFCRSYATPLCSNPEHPAVHRD